jgi:hypothetical protein
MARKSGKPAYQAFADLEAQFAAAEGKIKGSSMGGYNLDASTLRPGRAQGATGGSKPQTEFAGKAQKLWEANDDGWEFVESGMDD